MFVLNFWLCHLHVVSLLTLSSNSNWGQVISKIKQNDLDYHDTAPLILSAKIFVRFVIHWS